MQVTDSSSGFAAYESVIPAKAGISSKFNKALNALGPFESRPHFAVAVSGGSDSMALALLTDDFARRHDGRITALTVDHSLRPESKAEAEQVGAWLRARRIEHVLLTPPHTAAGNNLMNAARQWRYDALAEWCREHSVLHCLLAHHAADQRETIALHTARGTTEDGPSGMRRVRNYHGVRFLRPLLDVEKETLRDFLRSERMSWVEDPTNTDTRFARARLRHSALADAIPTDRTARERHVASAAARCAVLYREGNASLDLAAWRTLPPVIASQLLADLIRTVGGGVTRPRKHQTLQLADALRETDCVKRTLGGCRITTHTDTARIEPENQAVDTVFAPAKPLAASAFW